MRTFVWLLFSGLLWLLLIRLAADAAVPPQLVSLGRSLYLGTFSIFMMVELRRPADQGAVLGLNAADLAWYSIPAVSVLVLWWLSPSLHMTARLWVILGAFYVLQLIMLAWRAARMGMRSGAWDLIPPVLLALLLVHDALTLAVALVGLGLLAALTRVRTPANPQIADSLIMQLPSLCVAPVVLILLRDTFELSATLGRAHMEMLGMVINGVGSALWTATVMRSKRLAGQSMLLWGLGCAMAVVLALLGPSPLQVVGGLVASEVLRGCLWLGLTRLLTDSVRWQGFALNAVATALPLSALLVARHAVPPHHVISVYAAFHALVPLSLWIALKYRRAALA